MKDMYVVVEIKDAKIIWSDTTITLDKEHAKSRKEYFNKFGKGRKFEVLKVKQFQKVAC